MNTTHTANAPHIVTILPKPTLAGLRTGSLVKSRKTGRRAQVVSVNTTHARLAFHEHAPAWRVDLGTLARCYRIV